MSAPKLPYYLRCVSGPDEECCESRDEQLHDADRLAVMMGADDFEWPSWEIAWCHKLLMYPMPNPAFKRFEFSFGECETITQARAILAAHEKGLPLPHVDRSVCLESPPPFGFFESDYQFAPDTLGQPEKVQRLLWKYNGANWPCC